MYLNIWNEAAALRKEEFFMHNLPKIKCPITVIHGKNDPHPVKGVTKPLKKLGIKFEEYILEKCGHSPFREKPAQQQFYEILWNIIN